MRNLSRDLGAKKIFINTSPSKVRKINCNVTFIVGLYLPTIKGTKLSFLRAILCNKKKALKQTNVNRVMVPFYDELSVKNIYPDAMND